MENHDHHASHHGHADSNEVERRQHVRLRPEALSAMVYVGEDRWIVTVKDISRSGVKIANAPTAPSESEVRFTACLDGHEMLDVTGRVAHSRGNFIEQFVGIEFQTLTSDQSRILQSYLEMLGMEILNENTAVLS